jgi:hypothetical protein
MEELPMLSDHERAQLRKSLEDAEARIKAGQGIDYESGSFKKRLIDMYHSVKR